MAYSDSLLALIPAITPYVYVPGTWCSMDQVYRVADPVPGSGISFFLILDPAHISGELKIFWIKNT
jgi:hypothetical protein